MLVSWSPASSVIAGVIGDGIGCPASAAATAARTAVTTASPETGSGARSAPTVCMSSGGSAAAAAGPASTRREPATSRQVDSTRTAAEGHSNRLAPPSRRIHVLRWHGRSTSR